MLHKKYNTFLLALIAMVATGCSDDDNDRTPISKIDVDKTTLDLNESMAVDFYGVADQVVIYTGDEGHDYELREQSNTGVVVNKNHFTYSYSQPGQYKVVCVASCYGELGSNLRTDTCSYMITVIDNHTEILSVSAPQVLYDEVFAKEVNSHDWVLALPHKVVYNNKEVGQQFNQRLKFYMGSPLSKVFIADAPYSANTRYNLAEPQEIIVTADNGDMRDYTLFTLFYPEFKALTINTNICTITRDPFNYTAFTCSVPNLDSSNRSVIEYTLLDTGSKVYIEGTEISSGDKVQITDGTEIRLVNSVAARPDLSVEASVIIKSSN